VSFTVSDDACAGAVTTSLDGLTAWIAAWAPPTTTGLHAHQVFALDDQLGPGDSFWPVKSS
jgi:hypothetical protein